MAGEQTQESLQSLDHRGLMKEAHILHAKLATLNPSSGDIAFALDMMERVNDQILVYTVFDREPPKEETETDSVYTKRMLQASIGLGQMEDVQLILGRSLLVLRDKAILDGTQSPLSVSVTGPETDKREGSARILFRFTDENGSLHHTFIPLQRLLLTGDNPQEVVAAIKNGAPTGLTNLEVAQIRPSGQTLTERHGNVKQRRPIFPAASEIPERREPTQAELIAQIRETQQIIAKAKQRYSIDAVANAKLLELTGKLLRLGVKFDDLRMKFEGQRPPQPLRIILDHQPNLSIDVWAACAGEDTKTSTRSSRWIAFANEVAKISGERTARR